MSNNSTSPGSQRLFLIALSATILVAGVLIGRWLRDGMFASNLSGQATSMGLTQSEPVCGDTPVVSRAEIIFGKYCAQCHGEHGYGDGEGLRPLTPKPRDFRSTKWRFHKRRESIEAVIREGIPGTPMPASANLLSNGDISELAGYVLTLAEAGSESPSGRRDETLTNAGFTPLIAAKLPNLSILDVHNESQELSDVVNGASIVHFWSTSCTHCIAAFPRIDQTAEQLREANISMISICTDQPDPTELASYATAHKSIRFFVDDSGLAMHRFSTSVLPTMFLIDRDRIVIGKATGHLSDTAAASLIDFLSAP